MSRNVFNRATLATGQGTVSSAGNPVQLPDIDIPDGFQIIIKALADNTGYIYVGDVDIDSTVGFELSADTSIGYAVRNANVIYIDTSSSGDGFCYSVERQ